jgi:hypothetical protein
VLVAPAFAGAQELLFTKYVRISPSFLWIPAFAGMTVVHWAIYSQTLSQIVSFNKQEGSLNHDQ